MYTRIFPGLKGAVGTNLKNTKKLVNNLNHIKQILIYLENVMVDYFALVQTFTLTFHIKTVFGFLKNKLTNRLTHRATQFEPLRDRGGGVENIILGIIPSK